MVEGYVAQIMRDMISSEEAIQMDQRGESARSDVPLEMEVEWEITDKNGHPIDEMPYGYHKECFRAEALLEDAFVGPREAHVTSKQASGLAQSCFFTHNIFCCTLSFQRCSKQA